MPEDIECILEYVVECSKGYNNHMKWNEEAKLKADMMKHVDRWRLVSTLQIREFCTGRGMRSKDVETICDLHTRKMQGRRFVPQASYRSFEFQH